MYVVCYEYQKIDVREKEHIATQQTFASVWQRKVPYCVDEPGRATLLADARATFLGK